MMGFFGNLFRKPPPPRQFDGRGGDIEPGDFVESIFTAANFVILPPLTKGAVYVVDEVVIGNYSHGEGHDTGRDGVGLILAGKRHGLWAYPAIYFRKLLRPDPQMLERLISEPAPPNMDAPVAKPERVEA